MENVFFQIVGGIMTANFFTFALAWGLWQIRHVKADETPRGAAVYVILIVCGFWALFVWLALQSS